jgi:hypothetical protein
VESEHLAQPDHGSAQAAGHSWVLGNGDLFVLARPQPALASLVDQPKSGDRNPGQTQLHHLFHPGDNPVPGGLPPQGLSHVEMRLHPVPAVGFLQGSFLAEENKFRHGNFVFGYIISLFMVYLFSLIEYLSWMQPQRKPKVALAWRTLVSVIMVAHLVSGLVYWRAIVLGQYNL